MKTSQSRPLGRANGQRLVLPMRFGKSLLLLILSFVACSPTGPQTEQPQPRSDTPNIERSDCSEDSNLLDKISQLLDRAESQVDEASQAFDLEDDESAFNSGDDAMSTLGEALALANQLSDGASLSNAIDGAESHADEFITSLQNEDYDSAAPSLEDLEASTYAARDAAEAAVRSLDC